MSRNRDNFSAGVRQVLAHRAGFRCSKPDCRAPTSGPSANPEKEASIGIAAHIAAASSGGPRFDPSQTLELRGSVENGIWLCDNHAREIDKDPIRFTVELLRAWKSHAETEARAMLGRPLSSTPLDVMLELGLVRTDAQGLLVVGETNLPEGTRLMLTLRRETPEYSGQAKGTVANRRFAIGPFSNRGTALEQDWYKVEICAYFNGAWRQPEHVLAIVGKDGANLAGRLAVPLDPELDDTDYAVDASFECSAPVEFAATGLSPSEIGACVDLVRHSTLSVQGHDPLLSARPVGEVVDWFMSADGLKPAQGWQAAELAPGIVKVTFEYIDGKDHRIAEWHAMPRSGKVRYRNLSAKFMSWAQKG